MSLYNGPPRGGTRGGADQFSWENVKADKDREYYLGHSVKALTGRWQKGGKTGNVACLLYLKAVLKSRVQPVNNDWDPVGPQI